MPRTVSATEAKNRLGALIGWVQANQDDVIVETRGEPAVVHYTPDHLDELAGNVAPESNHATRHSLHKEWQTLYVKIAAILECDTDGEECRGPRAAQGEAR